MAKEETVIRKAEAVPVRPTPAPRKPKILSHGHTDVSEKRNILGNVLLETCAAAVEKNKRTLLAVGDKKDWDSYEKFIEQKDSLSNSMIKIESSSYSDIIGGHFPEVSGKSLVVLPFFPFDYWDRNIESEKYEGVYGNSEFYRRFRNFWQLFQTKMEMAYEGKRIHYINPPAAICLERDKEETKSVLAGKGIPVPKSFAMRDADEILGMIEEGARLYIKVRYGSMGKGISYFEKDRWMTNFDFENGKIVSRGSDYGWRFKEITRRREFLEELLKTDVVVEEAVESMRLDGRRFDIRFYVCLGEILRIYPRSNEADAVTTNISQGAKGESQDFIEKIPRDSLEKAKVYAVDSAHAIGLGLSGVDIILDGEGNPFVLEANSFPGFPRRKDFNLSARIFERIEKLGKEE